MGKKKGNESSALPSEDLLQTLGDFTSKENWDKFFTIRGTDDSFEWYAEWSELCHQLLSLLLGDYTEAAPSSSSSLQILVPGCGNSRLSEHLYDAGFHSITNLDFSKVVISDMLRRNIRSRPDMRWRVMDMTNMQFADETFDIVLDKGGLDALMEPDIGANLGNQYLSEVKRVLKSGGKFICLTLAESHVLGVLFSRFRFGWKTTVHSIPKKVSRKPSLQTFLVVAEKENSTALHEISLSFDLLSLDCDKNQASGLNEALESENKVRGEYNSGCDVLYSHEDLLLGVKGDLMKFSEGRRVKFTLGGQSFSYRAILLDARRQGTPFSYHFGVFLVPKTRVHEWLFSSEEGQWQVAESSKAARLVMVLLDNSHNGASMEEIQKDLSPLVKQLAPKSNPSEASIPFMMASDGIKKRNIIHEVISPLTGQVVVEDVIYESAPSNTIHFSSAKDLPFRRLVFRRTEGLIQSEALLIEDRSSPENVDQAKKRNSKFSSQAKRKGTKKRNDVTESSNCLRVYHGYLTSSYHLGIVSGFSLMSSYLKDVESAGKTVKAAILGLGAGLLPMFLHECIPFLEVKVVELDPLMLALAKDYFGFVQDERLKVHISDGIKFVRDIANSAASAETTLSPVSDTKVTCSNGNSVASVAETSRGAAGVDVLIIDVDSADSSSGLTCPGADFVEESFLHYVKHALPKHGLFIVNLVSRSQAIKDVVVSRMRKVFYHLFCLQLEEDVNLVLFGLCSEASISGSCIPECSVELEKLLKCERPEMNQSIIDTAKKIRYWK